MSAQTSRLGQPLPRVDAALKVTGAARYAADHPIPGVVYGVPLCSPVARGRLLAVDATDAQQQPGVLLVLTRENAPALKKPSGEFADEGQLGEARLPLRDDTIHYLGQYLGLWSPTPWSARSPRRRG